MTRVLLLVTDLQRGGTPLRVVRWSRWLRQADVEPVVGCLAPPGPLSAALDRLGIANFACGARHRLDPSVLIRLARHIRRYDPDIVHAFLFHSNVAARLAGRIDRPRPVVTSTATIEIERHWHRWLESLTHGLSDYHVVNAPAVAAHVIRELNFPADRVITIPNGLDLDAINAIQPISRASLGIPVDAPVIAWAGRMDPVKGLNTWVEIFDRVRALHPAFGVLIGDGPVRDSIAQELRHRHLLAAQESWQPGQVCMVGWSDSVVAWLKLADVLCFPSRTEGCPNVVLEAMAARCSVIASSVAGCCDVVQSGITGWLCPAEDIDAFSAAVGFALNHPEDRQRRASMARMWVERNQSPSAVLSGLLGLYACALRRAHL